MTARIHCDLADCADSFIEGDAVVGDWFRVEPISDVISMDDNGRTKHFSSLPCLMRWAGENALRQQRARERARA